MHRAPERPPLTWRENAKLGGQFVVAIGLGAFFLWGVGNFFTTVFPSLFR